MASFPLGFMKQTSTCLEFSIRLCSFFFPPLLLLGFLYGLFSDDLKRPLGTSFHLPRFGCCVALWGFNTLHRIAIRLQPLLYKDSRPCVLLSQPERWQLHRQPCCAIHRRCERSELSFILYSRLASAYRIDEENIITYLRGKLTV